MPETGSTGSQDESVTPDLAELAAAYGVAVSYEDSRRRPVRVAAGTVRRVLELLGVDTADPAAALVAARDRPWRRTLPPTVVARRGRPPAVPARVPAGSAVHGVIELAGGGRVPLEAAAAPTATHRLDGRDLVEIPLALPVDLPLGDHRLRVTAGTGTGEALLVVVPDRVPLAPGLRAGAGRAWGWMVQLYALSSAGSWGLGDYADLAALATWSASPEAGGAGVLLVNPLHATAPTHPVQPSPYYPASRRFASPLYLRPEHLPEYAAADDATRARVDALRAATAGDGTADERIDRDTSWRARREALELLFRWRVAAGRTPSADPALADFATWCALADEHGPDWRAWPAGLHDPAAVPRDTGTAAFHAWLQQCCDEQLRAARDAAREAGMAVGIVHDLAVGVDPGGADAWAMQDVLAIGATVGAPPDSFNQQGQDWSQPPWRPDRLPEVGYAPFREMVRAVLRRGGGIRIDHVLGLFRLWWVPAGRSAADGTYVRYDADALLGLLALEAARAGALVVGEDLGTVEPAVVTALADWGVLGSSVLWFERDDDGDLRPPAAWRELAMASVTTHDLPTAAGFLAGEQVRVRAELGLLTRSAQEEAAAAARERADLLALLRAEGLLPAADPSAEDPSPDDPSPEDVVIAMHALLARTPSRVVLAAPGDALGDLREPNLPGTVDEYPNWRLPVAGPDGRPVRLAEIVRSPRVLRLARTLAAGVAGGAGDGARDDETPVHDT